MIKDCNFVSYGVYRATLMDVFNSHFKYKSDLATAVTVGSMRQLVIRGGVAELSSLSHHLQNRITIATTTN